MGMTEQCKLCLLLLRGVNEAQKPGLDAVAMTVSGENAHPVENPKQCFTAREVGIIAIPAHTQNGQARKISCQLVGIGTMIAEMNHSVRPRGVYGAVQRLHISMGIRYDQKLHNRHPFRPRCIYRYYIRSLQGRQ